jgi:hypothetical protein
MLVASTATAAWIAACGTDADSTFNNGGGTGEDGGGTSSGNPGFFPDPNGDGGNTGDAQAQPIEITPANQTLTFTAGQPAPTLQLVAKVIGTGQVVPAAFTIDRGEIGSVGLATGLFTASGNVGGKATVTATWNGTAATTTVTVKLKVVQNGGGAISDAGADGGGAGGNGGVGGDGPGAEVDPGTLLALKSAPTADPNLALLYPYNDTVWPRGILAPLLMWNVGAQGDYDALLIKVTENNFEYEGTFKKNNLTIFKNHPLPQQAWKQLTLSNEGEEVTVALTFAKGGAAYGPISVKWKIASAPLKGTVYYNSYGTSLAKNLDTLAVGGGKFGGATLAIKGGSTDPERIAGEDGSQEYCRVCHSVAANGSVLITQRNTGGQRKYSTYDLKTGAETKMDPEGGGATNTNNYAWPAIYPDGTMFLGDSSDADGSHSIQNKLYNVVSGGAPTTPTPVATTGWPTGFRAAFPSFSPDGKSLAFTMFGGPTSDPDAGAGDGGVIANGDRKTIGVMSFDNATKTFGPIREVYRHSGGLTSVYPSFLPTNNAVIFHVETVYNGRDYGGTRSRADTSGADGYVGAHAELWWATVPATGPSVAARLDKLNGMLNGARYIPTGPNAHDDDTTLNYEPTVNPVPSGGYAWVVFTSRRLYGNVATINPFNSDPRYFDLRTEPTTKKLWVAAIDLNAPPGSDPSHPAFYLPAQELLAGNMRGYWVVDPCKNDGNDCETGDECCGGFCRPDTSGSGKLVCSNVVPTCAQEFEKCTTAADCCNSNVIQCINGRCAQPRPNVPK